MAVDSIFVTIMAIGGGGTLLGILLAARCLLWLNGLYKRDAQKPPPAEILWRLPLVFTPVSKIPYSFIVAALIAGRHAAVPAWLPWAVGGAFAAVAVVQGMVASALGNPDRSGWLVRTIDGFAARHPNSGVLYRRGLACKNIWSGVETQTISLRMPLSLVVLGLIETLAVLVLVGTVVFLQHLAH